MKNIEVLFVGFGSLGDIFPLLAVAKRMQQTRTVTFLTNEYFREHIEAAEVNFFPIGTVEDQVAARETNSLSGESTEGRKRRYEHVIGKSYKKTYDFIAKKVAQGIQLVVVTHGNLSPAVLACEAFDIPIIYTHYAPSQILNNFEDAILCASFYSDNEWWIRYIKTPLHIMKLKLNFEVKDQFNAYRKELGLKPVASNWQILLKSLNFLKSKKTHSKFNSPREIVLAPFWFCEPIDKSIKDFYFAGFPFIEETIGEQEIAIDRFIDAYGSPIVFTPGTAVEDVQAFVNEIIPICRKLGSPGIFCSKHGKRAFDLLQKVDDVPLLYIEHAKFSHLLPKARCLIHHGGIGTVAQAIRAGIPQILRPRMYDQPANGVRVMMFGLGGSIFPEAFHADTVANILLHVESNPKSQELLAYYSDLVRNENGVENCCKIINQFLKNQENKNAEIIESCAAC
ncbi:glycosyltransferase [Cellvibrio sp.]|uniref:glycosyltransferase n=1 Tax=Cellvibrio sp. TaxID=1965322 RepID=UPI003964894C